MTELGRCPSSRLGVTGGALLLVALAAACGDVGTAPRPGGAGHGPPPVARTPTPISGPFELRVPTYDGSGQTVEPDIVYRPGSWHGWEYWMVVNPYPNGNGALENPSIVASHDGHTWEVPPGVVNPVVPRDAPNSDPDLTYDPVGDRLILFYRQVRGGSNVIKFTTSANGVTWAAPRVAFREPNHHAVGPSTVLVAGRRPRMWYIDAGPDGCRSAVNRLKLRVATHTRLPGTTPNDLPWPDPVETDLHQAGHVLWETDVDYIPTKREYWAVYPAYPLAEGTCSHDDLFFARSRDGLVWNTYSVPFMRRGVAAWAAGTLYKSTFLYDPAHNVLRVWFSAMARDGTWHLGFVAYDFSEFERALAGG